MFPSADHPHAQVAALAIAGLTLVVLTALILHRGGVPGLVSVIDAAKG